MRNNDDNFIVLFRKYYKSREKLDKKGDPMCSSHIGNTDKFKEIMNSKISNLNAAL